MSPADPQTRTLMWCEAKSPAMKRRLPANSSSIMSDTHLLDAVCPEVSFVLRGDSDFLRLDKFPNVLVHFRADDDLAVSGGVAVAGRVVDRIADDRELHSLGRADETMHHFAAVDPDAHAARDLVAGG